MASSIPIHYKNATSNCRKHEVVVYMKNYSPKVNGNGCYVAWEVLSGHGETKIRYSEDIHVGALYLNTPNVMYGPFKTDLGTSWAIQSPSADTKSELKQSKCYSYSGMVGPAEIIIVTLSMCHEYHYGPV